MLILATRLEYTKFCRDKTCDCPWHPYGFGLTILGGFLKK